MRLNTNNTVKFQRKSVTLSATTHTEPQHQSYSSAFQTGPSAWGFPADGTRDKQQRYQSNVSCETELFALALGGQMNLNVLFYPPEYSQWIYICRSDKHACGYLRLHKYLNKNRLVFNVNAVSKLRWYCISGNERAIVSRTRVFKLWSN